MAFLDQTGLAYFFNKLKNFFVLPDGYYDELTSGNSEQLIASVGVNDKVPYNFRTSGGGADVGNRETVNAIVGGTIAWNQLYNKTDNLIQNGITFTNSNGRVSISGQASGNAFYSYMIPGVVKAGHKYLFAGGNSDSLDNTPKLYAAFTDSSRYNLIDGKTATIFSFSSDVEGSITVYAQSGWDADLNPRTFIPQFFDLTKMFGSTIADYIYSLEQSMAGAGVAWFKSLFPKDYYAYDAGSLQSVQTSAHKTIGFNQWDEEWELGNYDVYTGAKISYTNRIRSKNSIKVFPSTQYYIKAPSPCGLRFYDASGVFLSGKNLAKQNQTFYTPSNAYYMNFSVVDTTTYNHDICINLSWSGYRNGEYEPYEAHTYSLDDSLALRGIPKLDANNKLCYDGDEYKSDGTVTRKYGIVDLGTLNWNVSATSTENIYRMASNDLEHYIKYASATTYIGNIVCKRYEAVSASNTYGSIEGIAVSQTGRLYVYDNEYNGSGDAAAFMAAMSGVYLVYELATPTIETADPYQQVQIVNDFGTEEYVDAATHDVAVPVGHDTLYQANLRDKVQNAPNSPTANGDYVMRRTASGNEYVPLSEVKELPDAPTTDGTYVLKAIVSDGTAALSWVEEE